MAAITIDVEKINVILSDTFVKIAEMLTDIQLTSLEDGSIEGHEIWLVASNARGVFDAKTVFCFPREYADAAFANMDKYAPPEDREDYFKEFVNIIYGRMVSNVNNYIGKGSRFSPPVILPQDYKWSADDYENEKRFYFYSKYGTICFVTAYTIQQ